MDDLTRLRNTGLGKAAEAGLVRALCASSGANELLDLKIIHKIWGKPSLRVQTQMIYYY
jgi:hypothetical protein